MRLHKIVTLVLAAFALLAPEAGAAALNAGKTTRTKKVSTLSGMVAKGPVLAVRNTGKGSVFTFTGTSGPVGAFLVGNGRTPVDVAPFTTNAIGVATGLNADRVDGLDGADIRALIAAVPAGPKGDPGPKGDTGAKGETGPPGPGFSGAPAGGALTGTYPTPGLADGAVTPAKLALPFALDASSPSAPLLSIRRNDTTGAPAALDVSSASTTAQSSAIHATMNTTTPGLASAAIRGEITATGGSGIGVLGVHFGSGIGVYGNTDSGRGVDGYSEHGTGVIAETNDGRGLYATATTGTPLTAEITNAGSASHAIYATSQGSTSAIYANTGGSAGAFRGESAGSDPTVLASHTDVPGTALELHGGVKMRAAGGSGTPAFVQTVHTTGGSANVCNSGIATVIDNPYANGVPSAMLLITLKGVFNHPLAVQYNPGNGCTANRWVITTTDGFPLTDGITINVLVITTS